MQENSEDARSRLRRVVGEDGIAKLDAASVAVFGVGGVGSNCAEALVRGGVGSLSFIDSDEVQLSNVNRQAIAFASTVGRRKVEVMRDMALDINPQARIAVVDEFVLPENLNAVMARLPQLDYIIDAIDTVSSKIALALYAQEHGIAIISSMGAANKVNPEKLRYADLFETKSCPLCRAMRKQARSRGVKHLQVLYSCEEPAKVGHEEGVERRARANLGTMSYMPPIMGQMIAGFVIQEILAR